MRKLQLTFLFFISTLTLVMANAAQPGLWQAGGTGTFSLLFPQDSSAYLQIQMAREQVDIQLYDGFAAVKGTYWMYNTSDSSHQILTGYPINGLYEGDNYNYRTDIWFDDLYQLRVRVNNQAISTEVENVANGAYGHDIDNWYLWESTYLAQDTTKIEVYFLVNTHDAILRDGYHTESANGFIYLLESGATWKPPIGEGTIRLQLMDGIGLADVYGVAPDSTFRWSTATKTLSWSFTDFRPTPADNVVLTCKRQQEDFDFGAVTREADRYFHALDRFSQKPFAPDGTILSIGNPFVPPAPSGGWFWWLLVGLLLLLAGWGAWRFISER